MTKDYQDVAVVILAAGKGTRLNMSNGKNKTVLEVKGKPMVLSTVETIKKLGVAQIIAVVGHGKNSVEQILKDDVDYAIQKMRLGSGHAAYCGVKNVNKNIRYIVVVHGDDSHAYDLEIYHKLIKACKDDGFDMAHMVMFLDNPFGLGRIIRDDKGQILRVTEEKNATETEKLINEVNAGAYCFSKEFAQKFLPKIKFNQVKHEKYLTDIVEIAVLNHKSVASVELKKTQLWCGVNTLQELAKANSI